MRTMMSGFLRLWISRGRSGYSYKSRSVPSAPSQRMGPCFRRSRKSGVFTGNSRLRNPRMKSSCRVFSFWSSGNAFLFRGLCQILQFVSHILRGPFIPFDRRDKVPLGVEDDRAKIVVDESAFTGCDIQVETGRKVVDRLLVTGDEIP